MSLLTVVQDVCAVVGVASPTAVTANINVNRTMFEMLANANEMAQRIASDLRDWTVLRTSVTLVGDGHWDPLPPPRELPDPDAVWVGTSAFDLPANYRRMLKTSNVWRSHDTKQPMRFIADTDEWMQRRAADESDAWGEWTIYGGQIHVWPIMSGLVPAVPEDPPWAAVPAVPATTARFTYLDRNPVVITSGVLAGTFSERFTNDDDRFRLDERALKLGMIANWKQLHGSPYAEDMGTYSDCLANMMGPDSPAPILVGRIPPSTWGASPHGY